MAVVAPELRQVLQEPHRLFADPSDLGLVSSHRLGFSDLNPPAALRLPVEARNDAEAHEGVMDILGQPFRRNGKLNSRTAVWRRKDAAVARHQGSQELMSCDGSIFATPN